MADQAVADVVVRGRVESLPFAEVKAASKDMTQSLINDGKITRADQRKQLAAASRDIQSANKEVKGHYETIGNSVKWVRDEQVKANKATKDSSKDATTSIKSDHRQMSQAVQKEHVGMHAALRERAKLTVATIKQGYENLTYSTKKMHGETAKATEAATKSATGLQKAVKAGATEATAATRLLGDVVGSLFNTTTLGIGAALAAYKLYGAFLDSNTESYIKLAQHVDVTKQKIVSFGLTGNVSLQRLQKHAEELGDQWGSNIGDIASASEVLLQTGPKSDKQLQDMTDTAANLGAALHVSAAEAAGMFVEATRSGGAAAGLLRQLGVSVNAWEADRYSYLVESNQLEVLKIELMNKIQKRTEGAAKAQNSELMGTRHLENAYERLDLTVGGYLNTLKQTKDQWEADAVNTTTDQIIATAETIIKWGTTVGKVIDEAKHGDFKTIHQAIHDDITQPWDDATVAVNKYIQAQVDATTGGIKGWAARAPILGGEAPPPTPLFGFSGPTGGPSTGSRMYNADRTVGLRTKDFWTKYNAARETAGEQDGMVREQGGLYRREIEQGIGDTYVRRTPGRYTTPSRIVPAELPPTPPGQAAWQRGTPPRDQRGADGGFGDDLGDAINRRLPEFNQRTGDATEELNSFKRNLTDLNDVFKQMHLSEMLQHGDFPGFGGGSGGDGGGGGGSAGWDPSTSPDGPGGGFRGPQSTWGKQAAAAAADSQDGGALGGPGFGKVSGKVGAVQQEVLAWAREKHLNKAQVSALMATIQQESGFHLGVEGDKGTVRGGSHGLFQMNRERFARLQQNVPDWKTNVRGQLNNWWTEPEGMGGLRSFKNAKTLPQATHGMLTNIRPLEFLQHGDAGNEFHNRLDMARNWAGHISDAPAEVAARTPAATVASADDTPSAKTARAAVDVNLRVPKGYGTDKINVTPHPDIDFSLGSSPHVFHDGAGGTPGERSGDPTWQTGTGAR